MSVDSAKWRRLAAWGARDAPRWWARYSPPLFGLMVGALVPVARDRVRENLRRVRGERGAHREWLDVARTFASYASALTEALAQGSRNADPLELSVVGRRHLGRVVRSGEGFVIATVHTGGWEVVGPALGAFHGLEVMIMMQPERDTNARKLQDGLREAVGLKVTHVGSSPLDALPALRHLRAGGVVAAQIDRLPPGMRRVAVRGVPGWPALPEGPFRLAQLAKVPIVPIFAARLGRWRYLVEVGEPILLGDRSSDLGEPATRVAEHASRFIRSHPTQWFHFGR